MYRKKERKKEKTFSEICSYGKLRFFIKLELQWLICLETFLIFP
jgi:hypothetical protein